MNKKKLITLSITLGLSIFSIIGATFAYYNKVFNNSNSINTNITSENVCEVSSFETLYNACINQTFNDKNKVSTSRNIIRLTSDITLTNNLTLTNDAHIDLNGHTLTLNDYTFTISHSYAGTFMLYNGTIKTNTSGRIVINTTNATYLTENVTFKDLNDNEITDSTSYVKILTIDEMYTIYNAFYTISASLVSDIFKRPTLLNYDDFTALNKTSFESSLFLPTNDCKVSNTTESCAYIYQDIELLSHYLSNDINIEYTSSNTSVLSNKGNVNGVGTTTLSVILSSSSFENNYTCDFIVHVVASGSLDAGEAKIKSYLSDIYVEDSLKISSTLTHENYYFFTTGKDLPLKSDDGNVTYSYKAFSDAACTTEVETVSKEKETVYTFEPNEECYFLQITISNSNNETRTLVLNMYTIYVAKNETVARLILNELYGGSLVYNTANGPTHLYTIDEILNSENSRVKLYAETYKLTGISYKITEESKVAEDYKIENNELDIIVETPSSMKESSVTVTFTFEDGETTDVNLYVTYIIGSSETTNNFLPYYTSYDNKVSSSSSIETFTMPFAYENKAPYTVYDFSYKFDKVTAEDSSTTIYNNLSLSKPDSLNVKLCDSSGNVLKNFTSSYSDGSSITSAFDTYLGSQTLSSFASSNQGAYWEFSFDTSKLSLNDIETILIYNYKFSDSSSSTWTSYQKIQEDETKVYTDLTTSLFTINGGLIYSTDTSLENSVRNQNLFVYLYNNLNDSGETITTSSASSKVILNDWFNFDIQIDATSIPLTGDVDINGIQYLSSCTYLNLSGITMNETKINLISALDNVDTLNLSNTSITDYSILTSLKNMENLKILYLNNNTIENFDFLTEFPSLSEVYLYENTPSTNSEYYGSTGMCNYQAYEDLLNKGVSVYYKLNSSNTPMAYENTTDLNDYQRLKSIEYQSVLQSGLDISILYEKFESLTYEDFCLDNFTSLSWSYGGGTDATDATYFMVTASNSSGITLIVKYYVDRN